jgi:hypothetical protein
MKNLFFIITLTLSHILSSYASDGTHIGNGGSDLILAFKDIRKKYQTLFNAIDFKEIKTLNVSQKTKDWLTLSLPEIRLHLESVEFILGESKCIDINDRIERPICAITEKDLIYIYYQMAYTDQKTLRALFIHELGHLAGTDDHNLLDHVGSELAQIKAFPHSLTHKKYVLEELPFLEKEEIGIMASCPVLSLSRRQALETMRAVAYCKNRGHDGLYSYLTKSAPPFSHLKTEKGLHRESVPENCFPEGTSPHAKQLNYFSEIICVNNF